MSGFWILLSLLEIFTHVHTVKEAHIFMLTVTMSRDLSAEGHIGQVGLSSLFLYS